MRLLPEQIEFMESQLTLISRIETLLDQLLTTTEEDNVYGRGFGSFYPQKSINLMRTMKFAIQLELDAGKKE